MLPFLTVALFNWLADYSLVFVEYNSSWWCGYSFGMDISTSNYSARVFYGFLVCI